MTFLFGANFVTSELGYEGYLCRLCLFFSEAIPKQCVTRSGRGGGSMTHIYIIRNSRSMLVDQVNVGSSSNVMKDSNGPVLGLKILPKVQLDFELLICAGGMKPSNLSSLIFFAIILREALERIITVLNS